MEENLLPARLAAEVQQRRLCAQSTDVALSNILRDERQRISSIALAGYQGGAYRPTEGLAGVIEYPSMRDSYRWTGQPALVLGARVQHAFTWVFVIQEVYSRMVGGGGWRGDLAVVCIPSQAFVGIVECPTYGSGGTNDGYGVLHPPNVYGCGGGGCGPSRGGGRHGRSDERGDDGVDDPGCVPAAAPVSRPERPSAGGESTERGLTATTVVLR